MSDVGNVLIVGAGIAGLTLAAALRRYGVSAEVVERDAEWHTAGAGLSVQPNGLRVLRQLGLDTAVIEAGRVVGRWVFADQNGTVLCDIDLDSVWGAVGSCVGISRARLQEVLAAGARSVPCRLGTSITAISAGGALDRHVRVRFTDGWTGDYDVVVGADGIRSVVRELAFGKLEPAFAGQISWRSVAPFSLPGRPSIQFWLGDRCFFGLCSVGDGQTYGFANVTHERQLDPREGRLERLRKRFSHFGTTVQDYLACLDDDEQVHCSAIEWVEQARWHAARAVLIGDAAHASSPMMGQGGSLAMEDALVLAEFLRDGQPIEHALARYARRRAPRVHWVQEQSLAVAESFNMPSQARNDILRARGEAIFRIRYAPLAEQP